MQEFLRKLDFLADIETEHKLARFLERIAFVFMILMFVFAPHSVAGTQIAWLTGMFAWFVRQFVKPRRRLVRTPLDVPLWIFFGWSVITSIFSYDPLTSLDKLRNVALFLIFVFVVNVVRTRRAAVFLAGTLILSTMTSVVWTPIERIFGRGVEIQRVAPDSPFAKALLINGDTLLKADDKKVATPEDLLTAIEANETTKVYFYRPDFYFTVEVKRADLRVGGVGALERLGIGEWQRSRNWRSTGFLSHYATYAEVLQLVASLVFGLFIASLGGFFQRRKFQRRELQSAPKNNRRASLILMICLTAMGFALLLTVTRASQLGFLISATAIVLIGGSRKMLLTLAAVVLPLALIGLVFLQQSRQVGFFDAQDESIRYRQTVYREGFDLWTANARHFLLGVGMDSTKKYVKEWRLFDDGKLPASHFHSTPLQLVVERGLPALLLWLWVLWLYARTLGRRLKNRKCDADARTAPQTENQKVGDWRETGIVLGAFGGLIGFVSGGLVHYNLGTAVVAMLFFMLMGLSVVLATRPAEIKNRPKT